MAKRYLIVIEKGARNYSVFSPDLPGCVATGRTRRKAVLQMSEAINLHLCGLKADGMKVPRAQSAAKYVTIS